MKAYYKLCDPDAMDATLTVTMPIKEWRELVRQLPTKWPSWKFSSAVCDMIAAANKHFYTDGECL